MSKYTPEQHIIAFWNKVAITSDDDKCWLWLGWKDKNGYGKRSQHGCKNQLTHRIAWIYPNYVIPEGMDILHSCDNRACCNPKHLRIGTHVENMHDRDSRGRGVFGSGEKHSRSKLTFKEVAEIRYRYANETITEKQLGIEYNVHPGNISNIILNKTWKEATK